MQADRHVLAKLPVFSTATSTIKLSGEEQTGPITFEVVEREGGWCTVGPSAARGIVPDQESCLTKSARAD